MQPCTNINNNQPVINLNIIFQNNGQDTPNKTGKEARIMIRAQFALNKYKEERKELEVQIYEVFSVPQSSGGKPTWEREQMEIERDVQGKLVNQLKHEYDNAF